MPKGYWIAHVSVEDPDLYENYKTAARPVFERYGAKFIVRGGESTQAEGQCRPRTVVIEFDSYADALECYQSAEYQAARTHRTSTSTGDLIVIEGNDA